MLEDEGHEHLRAFAIFGVGFRKLPVIDGHAFIMIEKLELQALACVSMGSPFTAQLMRDVIVDYRRGDPVRTLLDAYPEYARPGLHLAAALHYLALRGDRDLARHYPSVGGDGDASAAWRAARARIANEGELIELLFRRIPQTNEPARSMPLLAAFASIADRFGKPLRILEVGASAGLNLRFDRFGYDGGDWQWGDLCSALVLRNRIRSGKPAHLDARIDVVERRGCDPNPLDVSREEDRLMLQSFVWTDQAARFERLQAAIVVAETLPARVDAENFQTWLPREGAPKPGCATVVVHTVVEEHLTASARNELSGIIAAHAMRATSGAPFAHVKMELDGRAFRTDVRYWPGSEAPATIRLSDGHAQEIAWA
jgi:hypothetical protein